MQHIIQLKLHGLFFIYTEWIKALCRTWSGDGGGDGWLSQKCQEPIIILYINDYEKEVGHPLINFKHI